MCKTPFWRLEPRPLSPTPHKHLFLWSDYRTKGARWYLDKLTILVRVCLIVSYVKQIKFMIGEF